MSHITLNLTQLIKEINESDDRHLYNFAFGAIRPTGEHAVVVVSVSPDKLHAAAELLGTLPAFILGGLLQAASEGFGGFTCKNGVRIEGANGSEVEELQRILRTNGRLISTIAPNANRLWADSFGVDINLSTPDNQRVCVFRFFYAT